MRSEWQTHKGRQFFFCNYANLEIEDLQVEMNAVDAFTGQQPEASVLMLTDVRGLPATRQVVGMFIKSASYTRKYLRKSAVIGIGFSGQKKVLFDAVMRISGANVMVFEDIENAKDWLMES
ncbi:MAG: hypothetical protein MUO77_04140 [Anaerolineales bacterium]|nr:hypothetical protein [Anaerolineales bacterium]